MSFVENDGEFIKMFQSESGYERVVISATRVQFT
jgi:hypothetical protein